MSINLITGTRGVAHITPSQDAHWHRGIVGTETCVFETGSAFEPEVMTNNRIKIKDGVGMIQGRMFNIDPNSYDEVTIANGSQGYNRIDLIVAEITVNPGAGTQSIAWNVVRGTPAEGTPTPPTYTSGDLDNGDLTAGIPIAQVTLTGINITACESVATMSKSISTLNTALSNIWQYKTVSRAIGYGANVTLWRYGPLVIISGVPKYTEAPSGGGAWITLDEKIPAGYRPASQCNFFFDRTLGGAGGVLYEFNSNGNIRIQVNSIGADWFNAFAVWFTNDPMPN